MRRQTLGNLAIAYGAEKSEAERRRIGRRSYVLAGRGLFAWIVLHRMGAERATALVTPEISPEAAAVLDSGKGAIYLTQHSGLFELIGSWSAKHYGVVTVGRDAGADPGTTMLIDMRSEMGLRTIEQGSPREILRTLKDGGKVAMLADQDIRRVNGAFVPFFGRLAHTPTGPAAMAVRLKVPIVCSVAEWRSFTTHTARAVDVLWPREDLQGEDAVLELTARCSEAIERAVRRRPEEWLWMHDRWRASPADLPESPIWPPERRAGGGAPGPAGATNAAGDAAGDAKP
jgi:KDO2-lipid IV(A) lauroyltransferase